MEEKKVVSAATTEVCGWVNEACHIYMNTKACVDVFSQRAKAQKRISKWGKDEENLILEIFNYIWYFNSLDENISDILNHHISEWPILNEFKDFIMPNSVRYESGNKAFNDVLIHQKVHVDESRLSFNRYLDLLSIFRGFFKKDANSDYVGLDTLRVDKSFEDVRVIGSCCWRDLHCRYVAQPYIPIPLKCLNVLVKDFYWNAKDVDVVNDYIANLTF